MNSKIEQSINSFLKNLAFKADGMSEGVDADGGYLVSTDVAKTLVDKLFQFPFYTTQAGRFLVGPNAKGIKIPVLADPLQSDPSANATRAFWQNEAAVIDESVPKLASPTLTLGNLIVMVAVTNEMVDDIVNLDDIFMTVASQAIQRKLASNMIAGTGVVKGVGYGGISTRATMTLAVSATPTDAQLQAMYLLLHPSAIPGAAWYLSQTTYANLFAVSGYTSIDKTFGKLSIMGIPAEVNPYLTTAPSHILLGNFSGYALAYKNPSLAKSMHIYYATNQQAFRIVCRFAGDAQVASSPCQDGVTRGYFVVPAGS